jgi:hypothetical protein
VAGLHSEGTDLAGLLGEILRRGPSVEVICSDFVTRGEFKYFLPRTRKAALACKLSEFGRHLSIMLAVHTRGDPLRLPHGGDFLSRKNLSKGVTRSVSAGSKRVTLRDKEPACRLAQTQSSGGPSNQPIKD